MASGRIDGTTDHPSGQIVARILWSSTPDTASNTSTVTADLYVARVADGYSSYGTGTWRVQIADTSTSAITKHVSLSGGNYAHIGTYTRTVPHNADGTGSVWISASGGIPEINWNATNIGRTVTLDTIPRASTPRLSKSVFEAGETIKINTDRAHWSFMHNLLVKFGGREVWAANHRSLGTVMEWAMPLEWLDQIPNSVSGVGSMTLVTYTSGGVEIGRKTVSFTARAPASVVPTSTGFAVADMSGAARWLQNLSTAKGTIAGAAGAYGSTVRAQDIYVGEVKVANGGTVPVTTSGALVVRGVVTDSRGRTSERTQTLTVAAYQRPKLTAAIIRSNSAGVADPMGDYLRVTTTGSASSVKTGTTETNTLRRIIKYRRVGTTTWTTARNDAITGLSWPATGHTIGAGAILPAAAWEVQIDAQDAHTTTTILHAVATAEVAMSWGRKGVGVGKVIDHTRAGLDLAGGFWWDDQPQSPVSHHASEAARNTAHPAPVVGQLATTGSGDTHMVWVFTGAGGWQPLTLGAPRIASGRIAITSGATASFTYAVSFPPGRFTTPPVVVATIEAISGSYGAATVRVINITATGFTLVANNVGTNSRAHYHWIATQN